MIFAAEQPSVPQPPAAVNDTSIAQQPPPTPQQAAQQQVTPAEQPAAAWVTALVSALQGIAAQGALTPLLLSQLAAAGGNRTSKDLNSRVIMPSNRSSLPDDGSTEVGYACLYPTELWV